jgi:hypothetical protein
MIERYNTESNNSSVRAYIKILNSWKQSTGHDNILYIAKILDNIVSVTRVSNEVTWYWIVLAKWTPHEWRLPRRHVDGWWKPWRTCSVARWNRERHIHLHIAYIHCVTSIFVLRWHCLCSEIIVTFMKSMNRFLMLIPISWVHVQCCF